MKKYFTFLFSFLHLALIAQIPEWTRPLSDENVVGIVELYEFGDNILIRNLVLSNKYDSTWYAQQLEEISLMSLDGELLAQKPVAAFDSYYQSFGNGLYVDSNYFSLATNALVTEEHPNPGFADQVLLKYNADLELVDSTLVIDRSVSKLASDSYQLISSASVWNHDTCFTINTYAVADSVYHVGQTSTSTISDTTAFYRNNYMDRRWVRTPRHISYDRGKRKIFGNYDMRIFEIDSQLNWTDNVQFYADAPFEERDSFSLFTRYNNFQLLVDDFLYVGAPATTDARGVDEAGFVVQKYDTDLNLINQSVLLRDTIDSAANFIVGFNSGAGEFSSVYDGASHIYVGGQDYSQQKMFVSKVDTNLNEIWTRTWQYPIGEQWALSNLLSHSMYDGIYVSVVKSESGNYPVFPVGDAFLYRIGANGDLSDVMNVGTSKEQTFLYPNPASTEVFVKDFEKYDVVTLVLYPMEGGIVNSLPVTGNTVDLSKLINGTYVAMGLDHRGTPLIKQKLIIAH